LKSNLFESVTKMLVSSAEYYAGIIIYHIWQVISIERKQQRAKNRALQDTNLSLPIWKIYYYLLHYPVLLFDIFLLEKI